MPPRYHVSVDIEGLTTNHDAFDDEEVETLPLSTPSSSHSTTPRTDQADYRLSNLTVTTLSAGESATNEDHQGNGLKARYLGYGVVRLFREYDVSEEVEVESDDTTVAIVAIPSYLSPTDVLAFVGESVTKDVSHFRMVNSENPNRFMALMKFRNSESARQFQDEFNERPFSAIESEKCHVIFVKSVMFRPLGKPNTSGIPYLLEDPFTLQVRKSSGSASIVKELPTCPVCLERMDSDVTGLVTIRCQHTFHCNCLSKWRDDTCPVCRYSSLSLNPLKSSGVEAQRCSSCGGSENLWICLICGNVGCGRYNKKHAIEHFEAESHCFAMDISTQRVWDYAGDNYVHRLLQNESDGKLVELPPAASTSSHSGTSSSSSGPDGAGVSTAKEDIKYTKLNAEYHLEYTNVLLSQLESQREYYESRLAESADKLSKSQESGQDSQTQMEKLLATLAQLQDEVSKMSEQLEKTRKTASTAESKLREEQLMTDGLSKNLDSMRLANASLKNENQELQDQVKDLMFYLESNEKFKDASDDVKNGTIVIHEPPKRSLKTKKSKNKAKK